MNLVIHVVGPTKSPYDILGKDIHEIFGPGYHLVDTGRLVAEQMAKDKSFAASIKPIVAAGHLIPPEVICSLLENELNSRKSEGAVIIGLLRSPARLDVARNLGLLGLNSLTILATCKKEVCLKRASCRTIRRRIHKLFKRSLADQRQVELQLAKLGARAHVIHLGHDRTVGFPVAIETVQQFRREHARGSAWKDPALLKTISGQAANWQELVNDGGRHMHPSPRLSMSAQ